MSLKKKEQELIQIVDSSIKKNINITTLVKQKLPKIVSADFVLELDKVVGDQMVDRNQRALYRYLRDAAFGLLKSVENAWIADVGTANERTEHQKNLATYMALTDKYDKYLKIIDEQKQK